jgi:membrane associated rhomboid family serine protease
MLSRRPRDYSAQVAIISLLAMLFTTLLCWKNGPEFSSRLAAIPEKVLLEKEYWRLWTGMAVHADLSHFAVNALFFAFFSYLIYGYFGFWLYPVWSLLLGGVTSYLSLLTYSARTRLVGSSGLVYLMAGFWFMMYVLVERRLTMKRRLLHATGVALIVFLPTSLQEGISYRTHSIGFGVGIVLALACFQWKKERIRSEEVVETLDDDDD